MQNKLIFLLIVCSFNKNKNDETNKVPNINVGRKDLTQKCAFYFSIIRVLLIEDNDYKKNML
jgi:hypothetical protein